MFNLSEKKKPRERLFLFGEDGILLTRAGSLFDVSKSSRSFGHGAALTAHRAVIHFRALSNPMFNLSEKKKPRERLFLFGEDGIRTHVGLRPNGFQDRLVMTTSIPLRIYILFSPREALANVPTSIPLRICILFCLFPPTFSVGRFSRPPRYVLLRCPKFPARFTLAEFRPLPLLFARFFRPRRRSQTSPRSKSNVYNTITPNNCQEARRNILSAPERYYYRNEKRR